MSVRAADSRLTVESVREAGTLEALAEQWSSFSQARDNLPLSVEWAMAAATSLHEPQSLHVLVAREGGSAAAVAPLAIVRRGSVKRIEIVGAAALYEPAGFLYRDQVALTALCGALAASGRPVLLQRVAAQDALLPAFRDAARGRGKLLEFDASATPFVEIGSDWESYVRTLSSRRRQDYRRARRGLERAGKVEVDIRHSSEASVEADLAEAMQVEAAGWKSRRGSALLRNARLRSFFRTLALRLARQGMLRLCFLRLDGTAIATQIGAEHGGRWWVLKIGYDERWAEHSPGIQLMWDVLRHAYESRLQSFELLGTAESWLAIWTARQRPCRTLAFYPYNAPGAVALGADMMRTSLRRLRA